MRIAYGSNQVSLLAAKFRLQLWITLTAPHFKLEALSRNTDCTLLNSDFAIQLSTARNYHNGNNRATNVLFGLLAIFVEISHIFTDGCQRPMYHFLPSLLASIVRYTLLQRHRGSWIVW
ncbi:hypothetical protein K439DRAFT_504051 [Ramaria rubella]|nr:hypothetical protein K439DRAFT_504051 [Ramaria rubella]